MTHPSWCDQAHGTVPTHSAKVGADIDLTGELSYAVYLDQVDGEPAQIMLLRHASDETSLVGFSLLEASILSDLIREGLGLVGRAAGL